jgi:hypothetical protein
MPIGFRPSKEGRPIAAGHLRLNNVIYVEEFDAAFVVTGKVPAGEGRVTLDLTESGNSSNKKTLKNVPVTRQFLGS